MTDDEAKASLFAALAVASESYKAGHIRTGSTAALEAVIEYLRALDLADRSMEQLAPLLGLLGALVNADRGLYDPHTQPRPDSYPGGSPKLIKESCDMAARAAAMQLLMKQCKMTKGAALAKITNLPKEKQEIEDARKNIRQSKAPADAIHFYWFILQEAGKHKFPPELAAEAVLQFVQNMTARKG